MNRLNLHSFIVSTLSIIMLKVIVIAALVCLAIAQQEIDDRYGNRIPYHQQSPPYLGGTNNHNVNTNNNHANNNDGFIDEFGQCGGLDWEGPKTCRGSLVCFKRSKYYAQCLSQEAAAIATRPPPQVIPLGGKCHGGSVRGPFSCAIGTACFIQTENIHGECKSLCPKDWFCAKQTLPEWAPCGGDGYVGLTKCKDGLQCYSHSKWYFECRSECPEGWKC
jgi:hypothetical protein